METVGVRELKMHLSRQLKRVRAGARLVVTDRGQPVATIEPIEAAPGSAWARELVAQRLAHWGGGKPVGLAGGRGRGPAVSAAVLEDRG